MKVFCSPTDEFLSYNAYLSSKGLKDVQLVPSVEDDFVALVKSVVAPNVSEYTIKKILEMHECFSGPGKDGGVYIIEQVGFTDQAFDKIKGLNGSFFVPLTMGSVYKALPIGKPAETNFFGSIDCFAYSAEFAKKFVANVDFRQPFNVIAIAIMAMSPPYKFVPIAERLGPNMVIDSYDGYWSSFLLGYQPTFTTYMSIKNEYLDFQMKKNRVEVYYKTTYGLPVRIDGDIRYVRERYDAIKDLNSILEQEECESSSQDPQVSSEAT